MRLPHSWHAGNDWRPPCCRPSDLTPVWWSDPADDPHARSGSDTKKLRAERALKLSVPFACIVIALFGAPLAITTPKSGAAWGVGVCLATTIIDLLLFQLSKAVGAGGVLPPTFAAWVPNVIVGAAAVWLVKTART